MSEAAPDCRPQVFVVDSQAPYVHMADGRGRRRPGALQVVLILLVVLALIGVLVEGVFIYHLYSKTQVATAASHTGDRGNTIGPMEMRGWQAKAQHKPSAHLSGSFSLQQGTIVWRNVNSTSTFTDQMDYKDGHLVVPSKGLYYVYSKVYLDQSQGCTRSRLMFMRTTEAYGDPIELMRSTRFGCHDNKRAGVNDTYLSGLFHLMPQDEIYVKLDSPTVKQPPNSNSFMGVIKLY